MNSKIIKNALWLFSGQGIGRALRVVLIIVAARALGAHEWGVFSYILSIATAFTVFSDIGLNAILVRESNKNANLAIKYLSTGLIIKLGLLVTLSVFAILAKDIIIRIPEATILVPLIITIFVFDSLRDFVSALARSIERMDIEAKGQIATNVSIVTFGLLFLRLSPSASSLTLGYAMGTFIGLLAVFLPLRNYFKGLIKEFNRGLIKEIIVSAWPFGLVSLMGIIMINTDILVLGAIGSATDVGLFSAAQKPIQLLYLIPAILATAFFPVFSREAKDNERFRDVLEQGIKSAYLFAFPLAVGGALTARSVIYLLYGAEFLPSYGSFALLALTFIFVYPSLFLTNALFARNSQKFFYGYLTVGVLINIALDIALIPHMGIAGCALSTLIVQAALFAYGATQLKKSISFDVFPKISKIIISTAIMALIVVGLALTSIHPIIIIIAGGGAYLLGLILLKEPTLKQIIIAIKRSPGITSGVEI